jgi:RimJ/RimL family protein N-acetyltransferase
VDLIFGRDAEVAEWVGARIPHVGSGEAFGPCAALGVASDGVLIAGMVYHNCYPSYGVGEASIAATSPRWATRGVIRALLHVPFRQFGWRRLTAMTRHDNRAAERLLTGIGFKREGAAREFFGSAPKVHGVVYGMLAREYDALVRRFG